MGEADDRAGDRVACSGVAEIDHERPVDLDGVDREVLEVPERRVATDSSPDAPVCVDAPTARKRLVRRTTENGLLAPCPNKIAFADTSAMFKRADVEFRRHRLNPATTREAPPEARPDYTAVCVRELSLLANDPTRGKRRPRR
jgi:hypothetical protein